MLHGIRTARITHTVAAIAAAVCLSLSGCTGCHRTPDSNGTETPTGVPENPAAIIIDTPSHDPQMLRSYAEAIESDADFTPADFANMMSLCEGSLQFLGQEVDNLQHNDDAADSYNVLTEFSQSRWTADLTGILRFVHNLQLPADMQMRADALTSHSARIDTLILSIQDSQLHGRRIFTLHPEN